MNILPASQPFPPEIDFESVRQNVNHQLCQLGQLEPNQFPVTERMVVKNGESCGIYFCLHGPRSVKLTAICDFEKENVIYYGPDGARCHEASLQN